MLATNSATRTPSVSLRSNHAGWLVGLDDDAKEHLGEFAAVPVGAQEFPLADQAVTDERPARERRAQGLDIVREDGHRKRIG
jgi:hypothetical protein